MKDGNTIRMTKQMKWPCQSVLLTDLCPNSIKGTWSHFEKNGMRIIPSHARFRIVRKVAIPVRTTRTKSNTLKTDIMTVQAGRWLGSDSPL